MTHFDYLLNAFEHASQADNPAKEGYAEKRRALLAYVRELESYKQDAERARKAEAEIERLQAEFAEAKKFKDGMLDVLGGACPNDHRSTPFEEFKGCTPCLRDELAECISALKKIANPIDAMQRELPDGARLNGAMATALANDPNYLRDVAKTILQNHAARKGEGE